MKTQTTGNTGLIFSTDRKTGIGFLKQGTTCPGKSGDCHIVICRRHHFVGFATNLRQQGGVNNKFL